MAGKGPTVTLTFAGDAKNLKATVKEVDSATSTLDRGLSGLGKGLGILSAAGPAAGIVAAGAIAGVGLAFVGMGVMAAAQSEKVKKAFTGLGDHVKSEVTKLAAPFETVLLGIEKKARATFDTVKPMLGEMFNVSAPYLDKLADGLLGFVTNVMPGLKTALTEAKPVIDVLSEGLKGTGKAIGDMFAKLTGDGGADQAATALKGLFDFLNNQLIPAIGATLRFLMEWGPTLIPLAVGVGALVGALKLWALGQAAVNLVMSLNPVGLVVIAIVALVAAIVWAWTNCETFRNVVKAVWEAVKGAFQAGVEKAKALFAWFGELPGKISAWFGQVKDAAVAKLSALVGWVRGIPGMILGALGGLGSLLYNSGKSLLEGLWNGAKAALGWVKTQFSNALSAIRNLFPFSPAKEGPFSGSGYTSHSGRALMEDFGKGMQSGGTGLRGVAATALGGAQGALSSPVTGGSGRGGALELRVAPGADSALAALLHGMARRGELQFVTA